ncbi:hypothetical protein [uncultured Bifidobacterium sp.]|uniref:hypothetical protein n=1 Tax=uncultured Bifidobacterium sp. TaxID=165187 RepID=UPI002625DC70|nr:hypothetical protein [uncultured Bifidobacterium sp.]
MDIGSDASNRIVFPQRGLRPPQIIDGRVRLAIDGLFVPYHITTCFRSELGADAFHAAAVRSCQLACMAADIVRGRSVPSSVFRVASHSCVSRLQTMAMLLEIHRDEHGGEDHEEQADMRRYPVVPFMVNGMLVSPERFEMCVRLGIGRVTYWSSLVFRLTGSRWLCVLADFG